MAGFSLYSNRDSNSKTAEACKDTEGLIISSHQGMDRCASLLKALLSPIKKEDYPQKENDNPKTLRQLPLSATSSSKAESRRRTCGGQSHQNIVTKPVQTVSDNMRHSANKKQAHKNCKTVNTANTRKNKKQAGLFLSSSATTVKRRKKLSRPIPVAMSTPQTNHHPTDSKSGATGATSNPHIPLLRVSSQIPMPLTNQEAVAGGVGPIGNGGRGGIAVSLESNEVKGQGEDWPPMMWLPPYYQIIDTREQNNSHQNFKTQQLVCELKELKNKLETSQKALEEAQQQVKKLQEEKNELGQQYVAKIDVLEEVQKEERDTLTLKLSQLEIGLREIETQWKEKYRGDIELEQQELYDENQMLKLSVAEKETELLQSQDALLELRQCLAHILIGLKPSSETDWLMISQKDVSTIQAIVNTGHCNDKDEEEKDAHSLTPDQASSSSSGDCTNTQSCSGWTTSTEVRFRCNLAALDADIARLQIQFNVAQDLYH